MTARRIKKIDALRALEAAAPSDIASMASLETRILDDCFPAQRAFVLEPARLYAAICSRRASKTFSGGVRMILECLRVPGSNCLYAAGTRLEAKGIFWEPILKFLDKKYSLGIEFGEAELVGRFPNGSRIKLFGLDANAEERKKVEGQKYAFVLLDEVQDYRHADLKTLVQHGLRPAMADVQGTICLAGTPSNGRSYFYEITQPDESKRPKGWAVHHWTAFDNPHVPWADDVAQEMAETPGIETTAMFRQRRWGEWVFDETLLCYPHHTRITWMDELPALTDGDHWIYALGEDLGFTDDTAFVVLAYRAHDPRLFVCHAESSPNMDLIDIIERTKAIQKIWPVVRIIVDTGGLGRTLAETMQRRAQLAVEAADKTEKEQHMRLLEGDMARGKLVFLPGAKPLFADLQSLSWDRRKLEETGARVEDPGCPNHKTDALLYAWRKCYHYAAREQSPAMTARDRIDAEIQKQIDAINKRQAKGHNTSGSVWANRDPDLYGGDE